MKGVSGQRQAAPCERQEIIGGRFDCARREIGEQGKRDLGMQTLVQRQPNHGTALR
jgi:hypothetical protein